MSSTTGSYITRLIKEGNLTPEDIGEEVDRLVREARQDACSHRNVEVDQDGSNACQDCGKKSVMDTGYTPTAPTMG